MPDFLCRNLRYRTVSSLNRSRMSSYMPVTESSCRPMDVVATPSLDETKQPERPKLRDIMGPGLITGASDDDPSGIATYSQAGAQFGYSLGWTLLLTYPLMCAIQLIRLVRISAGSPGWRRRQHAALLPYLATLPADRTARGRQYGQYRCRSRRDGRGPEVAD